jgi:phosphate starvation-inducible PhoH-like protein
MPDKQQRKRAQSHIDRFKETGDFNSASNANGANGARKEIGEAPVLNKAQILSMLKKTMPAEGPNGQVRTLDGEELNPTKNQRALMKMIDEKPVVMVEGPAGSGKTIWACERALRGLLSKKFNQICLNTPAVTAGEEIGFLKGGLEDKMSPHVNQILEAFDDFIGEKLRKDMMAAGLIKITPYAFLRGSSLKKTFSIFDESSNASGPNLQTALMRIGKDSTFVFTGDAKQNDRTPQGGCAYTAFVDRYTTDPDYAEYVGHVVMDASDVRRHGLVQKIVEKGDDRPLDGYETHKSQGRPQKAPALA